MDIPSDSTSHRGVHLRTPWVGSNPPSLPLWAPATAHEPRPLVASTLLHVAGSHYNWASPSLSACVASFRQASTLPPSFPHVLLIPAMPSPALPLFVCK